MEDFEHYVYKTDVKWSLLTEGLTLPVDNQVIFARNMGKFLQRGESKSINIFLNGENMSHRFEMLTFLNVLSGRMPSRFDIPETANWQEHCKAIS
jgi:hypothetical protein